MLAQRDGVGWRVLRRKGKASLRGGEGQDQRAVLHQQAAAKVGRRLRCSVGGRLHLPARWRTDRLTAHVWHKNGCSSTRRTTSTKTSGRPTHPTSTRSTTTSGERCSNGTSLLHRSRRPRQS